MNQKLFLAGLALAVVAFAGAATMAQRGSSIENIIQIKPGQEVLLHASNDTVVEIYVDLPLTSPEKIKVSDSVTGKKLELPSGAWVRAQGHVVVSRDMEPGIASPQVRWRYVESMFASFSRPAR